jgi:hypothetical protein
MPHNKPNLPTKILPDLQPTIRLAEEMGESLGAGQVLLGNVQKEARVESVIQEC